MSRDASISFDWAGDERRFRLAIGQLRELQEKCSAGPMEIMSRLQGGTWRIDDVRETMRLGLIGGGTPPGEALGLVRRYVDDRPFGECVSFALFVLMAAIYGTDQEPAPGKAEPAESLPTTAAA